MTAPAVRTLDSAAVLRLLAHRYPCLLVDRIELGPEAGRAVGYKRVTAGEWLTPQGAREGAAVPGLYAVEALAQTAAGVLLGLADGADGVVGYFAAIERVRLRGGVAPGETLRLEVTLRSFRRGIARLAGAATAAGRPVATAAFTTVLRG